MNGGDDHLHKNYLLPSLIQLVGDRYCQQHCAFVLLRFYFLHAVLADLASEICLEEITRKFLNWQVYNG